MKRKTNCIVCLILLCVSILTGCGTTDLGYKYNGVGSFESSTMNSVVDGMYYEPSEDYMDYGSTGIYGDLADYSYKFEANGEVKEKDEVLSVYEEVQEFVLGKDGYISEVRNNYNGYPIDFVDSYYSDNEKRYVGQGTIYFDVQVDKSCIEDVVKMLDDFVNEKNLEVTRYTQYIKNYVGYDIVEEKEDTWYGYEEITKEELDKRLKYATLDVRISYYIPRNGFVRLLLHVKSFVSSVIEFLGSIVTSAFGVVLFLWAIFFVGIVPIYKMFRRMMYKHRKKKPEYYEAKEIVIKNISEFSSKEEK